MKPIRQILIILSLFLFSLTIISCGEKEKSTDSTATTTSNPLFVSVGNSGTILTSTDGTTWTTVSATYEHPDNGTISLAGNYNGVTYGISTFVAVGTNYAGSTSIITSTDATAWTPRTSGTSNTLNDVTYANSTFVAVGNSGTVLKSSDGTTWTTVSATYEHPDNGTISLAGNYNGVTYGISTFVAVGTNYAGSTSIITSTDATAWTPRTSGTSNTLYEVTYKE